MENILEKIKSKKELSYQLGYKENALNYILYKIPSNERYRSFEIPKKNGGIRNITSPNKHLKLLQKRLASMLSDIYESIYYFGSTKKSLSHGFRKNHSIITNAYKHKNKRYVLNLDLKDFFPSINFGRVRGFFIKNNQFCLNKDISTIIAQIVTYENQLPQGSPSSPIISNFIANILDINLVKLAKKYKCTYSRYADDITFSTNQKIFPVEIAYMKENNKWELGRKLSSAINRSGFLINEFKTSMQYKTSRQTVTGLTVNKKVNINNAYYRNVRAYCNSIFKNDYYILFKNKDIESIKNIYGTINQLEGMIGFIYQIKKEYYEKNGKNKYHPEGIIKLYQEFLIYKYFVANKKPVILLEGKTDIIYLKCAIIQLGKDYQELIKKNKEKTELNISFFNISKNIKEVFGISSGSSGLIALINAVKKYSDKYTNIINAKPSIFIFDPDDGAKDVVSIIKKSKNEIVEYNKIYNIINNIYVIFTNNEKDSEIEDLFDNDTLQKTIEGKVFSRNSKIDTDNQYGKNIFAEKVIKP